MSDVVVWAQIDSLNELMDDAGEEVGADRMGHV